MEKKIKESCLKYLPGKELSSATLKNRLQMMKVSFSDTINRKGLIGLYDKNIVFHSDLVKSFMLIDFDKVTTIKNSPPKYEIKPNYYSSSSSDFEDQPIIVNQRVTSRSFAYQTNNSTNLNSLIPDIKLIDHKQQFSEEEGKLYGILFLVYLFLSFIFGFTRTFWGIISIFQMFFTLIYNIYSEGGLISWTYNLISQNIFVTTSIIVFFVSLYYYIEWRERHTIALEIFHKLKTILRESSHTYQSGLSETEIKKRFSKELNISYHDFDAKYFQILSELRLKDQNIRLFNKKVNGADAIYWQWYS